MATNQTPFPARVIGVGTANSPHSYSQNEILDYFGVTDDRVRRLFLNGAIERRSLCLPPRGPDGLPRVETQGELLAKHRDCALDMADRAVRACLDDADEGIEDVRYLAVVTSTGFLCPGLSALLIPRLGLSPRTVRIDVVGMGCNAGLNGLAAATSWAGAHPGELAVLVCAEACSAAYVVDGTMPSWVVNSLFGDGGAAVAVRAADPPAPGGPASGGPAVLAQAAVMVPDTLDAMHFEWDEPLGKFSFFLERSVPDVIGAQSEAVVDGLLKDAGLCRADVAHWVVHAGGKRVIEAVRDRLGLGEDDLRHSAGVLRDHGNLSSGSFLFSYQRLLRERTVREGDYGVLMTMGPGIQIETALIRF